MNLVCVSDRLVSGELLKKTDDKSIELRVQGVPDVLEDAQLRRTFLSPALVLGPRAPPGSDLAGVETSVVNGSKKNRFENLWSESKKSTRTSITCLRSFRSTGSSRNRGRTC